MLPDRAFHRLRVHVAISLPSVSCLCLHPFRVISFFSSLFRPIPCVSFMRSSLFFSPDHSLLFPSPPSSLSLSFFLSCFLLSSVSFLSFSLSIFVNLFLSVSLFLCLFPASYLASSSNPFSVDAALQRSESLRATEGADTRAEGHTAHYSKLPHFSSHTTRGQSKRQIHLPTCFFSRLF